MDSTSLVVVLGAGAVLLALVWWIRARREESCRMAYHAALHHLAGNPSNPNARIACLHAGREYYRLMHPDTTAKGANGSTIHQDNTAAREALINSDINARVGHLLTRDEEARRR